MGHLVFSAVLHDARRMGNGEDKAAHGAALRRAVAESSEVDRTVLEDVTGRGYRTITNWLNGKTMPSDEEKAILRKLLGEYEQPGDAVERAVRRSELIDWRQDKVLSEYKRNLHEQRAEAAG